MTVFVCIGTIAELIKTTPVILSLRNDGVKVVGLVVDERPKSFRAKQPGTLDKRPKTIKPTVARSCQQEKGANAVRLSGQPREEPLRGKIRVSNGSPLMQLFQFSE